MQPREAVPLWVGLTLGLMIVGAVMYLTGYFVLEDFLAFFKWLRAFRVGPSVALLRSTEGEEEMMPCMWAGN
jgi:hypothetical protein